MRIVTWNCNGALRNKLAPLAALAADLYIIQECEDPARCPSADYRAWAGQYLWTGTNKHRGLAVFAKSGLTLEAVPLETMPLELFLPCYVHRSLALVAVWARAANSPTFAYIGQVWKFLQRHQQFLAVEDAALIGDLNSNACWDLWDRWWNHSDVVRQLHELGLTSVYHHTAPALHGAETQPTFYLYRKRERPYHIDYAFLSTRLLQGASCTIGDPAIWLALSDHMPLIVTYP
ncbi:MAG: endonuclease/exonuclease/phosphatase family protein [Roseiflexaceae bacterium]